MSDIVKQDPTNLSLVALAEELNISLDNSITDSYREGNSFYTAYTKPKNIRATFDTHKLDGVIKWTSDSPDKDPQNREQEYLLVNTNDGKEPFELNGVTGLKGIIVNYQQKDELRYYDGEATQVLCSVVGYKNEGEYIKALPNIPYGLKHTFQQNKETKKWGVNTTIPNPIVESLGLVGSRGEKYTSCADCIKCGLSTQVIAGIGEGGSDKTISCDPRGKLFLAVFEVVVKKRQPNPDKPGSLMDVLTSYKVSDLLNSENESIGEFMFMEIAMPKTNIQGRSIKNEQGKKDEALSIMGYEALCRDLAMKFKDPRDPMRNSKFHNVSLTWRKATPTSQMSQLDIRSEGIIDTEQFKRAYEEWALQCPIKEVQTFNMDEEEVRIEISTNVRDSEYPTKNITVAANVSSVDKDSLPF